MMASAELIVYTALKDLVPSGADEPSRCAPDISPAGVERPNITYQALPGKSTFTLNGPSGVRNARMQINVWAKSRPEAVVLMNEVIAALIADPARGVPIGDVASEFEADTKLYGSRLDFSIWF